MKDSPDDRRQRQSGEESGDDGKGFANVLNTELGKTGTAQGISVRTNGYTRMGMPTAVYIKMRDYTYQ